MILPGSSPLLRLSSLEQRLPPPLGSARAKQLREAVQAPLLALSALPLVLVLIFVTVFVDNLRLVTACRQRAELSSGTRLVSTLASCLGQTVLAEDGVNLFAPVGAYQTA